MKSRASAGYTITEVMIVLVVTASLFGVVYALLGGRQGETETTQAVRGLEAKFQSVTSDVANGFYPNGFKCQVDDLGGQPSIPGGSFNSGQNIGCVFIGKVINFKDKTASVLTVVGRQYTKEVGSNVITTLAASKPYAVATAGTDVTETYNYRFDLEITKVAAINADGTTGLEYGGIGLMSELGNDGSGNPMTGARSTLLYGIKGAISPNAESNIATAARINVFSNFDAATNGIRICLKGGNGKKGEITLGAGGSQTATVVLIDSGVGNECP